MLLQMALSFFVAELYFFVYMCRMFIHSSVDGHLDWFRVLLNHMVILGFQVAWW